MNRLINKKALLILGGLVVAGGLVIGLNSKHSTKAMTSQNINLYETANISTLDISKVTDSVSADQLNQVDEGLYHLDKNGTPTNALADKTTITNHGKTYLIDLKHTGRWSNGQPVTAKDFVYSWKRTLNPKTKSEFTYIFTNIKNADAISAGKKSPDSLGVKADGKYQLQITLSKPASYFKKLLAGTTFYPLNQTAVEKYGSKYGTSAKTTVYNGPFTLSGWNGTNDTWTLKKNSTYRDKQVVKLQKINYQIIKSSSTAYNDYQANKLDSITLSGQQNVQNSNNPELKTLSAGRIGFIQYNQKNKITANQDLRTVISLAINRQQLTKKVLENGSIPAKTFGVKNMLKNPKNGHDFTDDASVKNTAELNVAKAKQLFKSAQKQLGQKNITMTITAGDDDTSKQAAEFVQGELTSNLKGLSVKVQSMPFNVMLSEVSKGNFQMNLTSWGMDFADPTQSLTILTSSSNSNMGHYRSKYYDQAMTAADGKDALNSTARYQDLVKAAKIALNNQAVTPLYEGRTQILVKPRLKNVVYNNFSGSASYRTAYVK